MGERGAALDVEAGPAQAEVRERPPAAAQPASPRRPPTGRAPTTTWRCGGGPRTAPVPGAGRAPAGAALGRRRPPSASSTWSGAPSCRGRCSRSTGAPGPGCCGPSPRFALDRHTDAYEEIRPPTLVLHRDDGLDRATCPSSPTTPITSNATTCGPSPPPRCRSPRCTATRSSTRPSSRCGSPRPPPASAGRRVRPGATPGACCGCTSSTRWSCSPTPRAEQAPAVHADILERAEGLLRELGLALPGPRPVRR